MIEHVFRRTSACTLLDEVIIATCDDEIASAAAEFDAKFVMTSAKHARASDRVAEAIANVPADIVVMVQGDEPMILPEMIAAAIQPLLDDPAIHCVNLASPIRSVEELNDPNTIKVVVTKAGSALFFSREPIPTPKIRQFKTGDWFKQVCVIPFRRETLQRFASLPQGPLESAESIDMLRLLENGIPVQIVKTMIYTHAVDTPDDLTLVAAMLHQNPWPGVEKDNRTA
jgi:3-deoxy-manno-octulosonate cytidylyltransferase (CMP-KDO synthetase)